ncbi:MAG: hypothetical protein IT385_05165 [Deltaproteobacteria bacterium]|nr:hypothetical protein [Deltaproteobacteria bacterium]
MTALRALVLVPVLALALAPTGRALARSGGELVPSALGEARLKTDFALAFRIAEADVLEVIPVDVDPKGDHPGAIAGRYRERDGRWAFPGLAVYIPCGRERCVAPVSLGSAATRVAGLEAIDLDAPRRELMTELPRYPPRTAPPPLVHPTWPAVVVGVERDGQSPQTTSLVIVSLVGRELPFVVADLALSDERPQPTPEEAARTHVPSFVTYGASLTKVVLETLGDTSTAKARATAFHRLTTTVLPIGSRTSLCSAPKPYDVVYELDLARSWRYETRADNPPPRRPCE